MVTTAEHLAARADTDLRARLMAAAEQAGKSGAAAWVDEHIGQLLTAPVAGDNTIAGVYGYAWSERNRLVGELPPAPGVNPGAVTDAHLAAAIAAVLSA